MIENSSVPKFGPDMLNGDYNVLTFRNLSQTERENFATVILQLEETEVLRTIRSRRVTFIGKITRGQGTFGKDAFYLPSVYLQVYQVSLGVSNSSYTDVMI